MALTGVGGLTGTGGGGVSIVGADTNLNVSSGVSERILVGPWFVRGVFERRNDRDRIDEREEEDEEDAGDVDDELEDGVRLRLCLRAELEEELDDDDDESYRRLDRDCLEPWYRDVDREYLDERREIDRVRRLRDLDRDLDRERPFRIKSPLRRRLKERERIRNGQILQFEILERYLEYNLVETYS